MSTVPAPAVETVTTYTYDLWSSPIVATEAGGTRRCKVVEVIVEINHQDDEEHGEVHVDTVGYTLTKAGDHKSNRQSLYMGTEFEAPFVEDARRRQAAVTS